MADECKIGSRYFSRSRAEECSAKTPNSKVEAEVENISDGLPARVLLTTYVVVELNEPTKAFKSLLSGKK